MVKKIQNVGLVGPNGFIGSNLARRSAASAVYGRNDGAKLANSEHEILICAGAPAEKWKANRYPEDDSKNLEVLAQNLSTSRAKTFVLISTIDVLGDGARNVETDDVSLNEKDAYGLNRYKFELDVSAMFENVLILRLPGMFGPGLKKNLIYDLLNKKDLPNINSNSTFQWFDVRDIWPSILVALREDIKLLHLATEPISVLDLVTRLEPSRITEFDDSQTEVKEYSMKTAFAGVIADREGPYLKSKNEVAAQIESWYEYEKTSAR